MSGETDAVYSEDSYLSTMEARLLRIEGTAGLVFDRSNFFPAGGGQPGDRGFIERADGTQLLVVDTRYNEDRSAILLVLDETSPLPEPGETLILHVDWARRYRMMRMHTALHLLTVVCPYPVTGAAVGEDEGRIDFDLPEADTDKTEVTRQLMELVRANHPVSIRWITDAELDANPSLVKSAHVRPPRGSGVCGSSSSEPRARWIPSPAVERMCPKRKKSETFTSPRSRRRARQTAAFVCASARRPSPDASLFRPAAALSMLAAEQSATRLR